MRVALWPPACPAGHKPSQRLVSELTMCALLAIATELTRLRADRKGITSLEYGILAAIMVPALLAGFAVVAGDLTALFNTIGPKLVIS